MTEKNDIIIREALLEDAIQLASLSHFLSSAPVHHNSQSQRSQEQQLVVSALIENPDHILLVASSSEKLLGWLHACKMIRLTSPEFVEIVGLIVHPDCRGLGVGSKLVDELKHQFQSHEIRVRCNCSRELAHKFYLKHGFNQSKSQHVFNHLGQPNV